MSESSTPVPESDDPSAVPASDSNDPSVPAPDDVKKTPASVTAFNHYYATLLRDVKAHGACRGAIKNHYHRFDHADDVHVTRFVAWTPVLVRHMLEDADKALEQDVDTQVFEGIYLEQVLSAGVSRPALVQALFALAVAARLFEVETSDDSVAVVRRHLQTVSKMTSGVEGNKPMDDPSTPFPTPEELMANSGNLDDINDDRARALVLAALTHAAKHAAAKLRQQQTPELPPEVAEQLRKLENTKIGRMAREISESIGPGALGDPAGLASVIGKVGGAMQAKMRNGELDHGELLSEAMGMLGTLPSIFQAAAGAATSGSGFGDPTGSGFPPKGFDMSAMADMMKGMLGSFGGAPKAAAQQPTRGQSMGSQSARTRLATKLARRQQETSD